MYAEIIINSDALEIDRMFTYKIPDNVTKKIGIGHRVKVPFGARSKPIEGFIFSLIDNDKISVQYKIKEIIKVCDDEAILTQDDINLVYFLRRKYLCKYIDAVRMLIPSGIMTGSTKKKKYVICIEKEDYEDKLKKDSYINI